MKLSGEQQYLNLMQKILDDGDERQDRTKVGTKSIFGTQMRFELDKGFPLLTTKKVWFKGIAHELLWMLNGSTNIKYLKENKVNIWNEWADENGELGPIYGSQWRKWRSSEGKEIDQISELIKGIKDNPSSRRHILSAWNVAEIPKMRLPPCHVLAQFDITSDNKLSCSLYQRSGDFYLGVPYNIASYSLLTHMIAEVCGLEVGEFIHTIGNTHLYLNHLDQAKTQLKRESRQFPSLKIVNKRSTIFDFQYEDFKVVNYNPHPAIKAPIAV